MDRKYSVSVAMATYNGQKYIKEQIFSILSQLEKCDELVISDDGSTDNTIEIIKKINDSRIKLVNGPHMGVKQNFANAISNCTGKYIFLSDQDDVWLDSKVDTVLNVFMKNKCTCVVHDCTAFDDRTSEIVLESFFKFRNSKSGLIKNIIKNSYIGCCMAFDKELVKKVLPIPNNIEMHDQWIGLMSEKYGRSIFIKDKLLKYRRHENNVSSFKRHPIYRALKNRLMLITKLIIR